MKKGIFITAIFAVFFFNSCDLSSTYPQTDAVETSAKMSPEEAKMAAIKQKLAEKKELGEITDEQAAALLLLILSAIASESANAESVTTSYSNEYGNSGYSEDEVMDMVVDQAINPVGTINYNY